MEIRQPGCVIGSMRSNLLAILTATCGVLTGCSHDGGTGDAGTDAGREDRLMPYHIETVELSSAHYSAGGWTVDFGSRILLWDDPVGIGTLDALHVQTRLGSQATDQYYIPIRAWLEAEAKVPRDSIRVTYNGLRRNTASSVYIADPQREMLGLTVAAGVSSSVRVGDVELDTVLVTDEHYSEVDRPSFSSVVRIPGERAYFYGYQDASDGELVGGTYVGSWVLVGDDESAGTIPVTLWLREGDQYSPSNRYVTEVSCEALRFRDRLWKLLGRRILVARTRVDCHPVWECHRL